MSWCPQCKNEYREGIKVCADCGCELVENEQVVNHVAITFGEEEQMSALKDFLEFNKIQGAFVNFDEKESVYELLVQKEDQESACKMARIYLQQEAQRASQDEEDMMSENAVDQGTQNADAGINEENQKKDATGSCVGSATVYMDNTERAEENRSSAWTLMFVGAVGIVVMVLGMMNVIPLRIGNPYMFYGVMIAVFLLFIVMGIVSMKNAKIFAKKAESENTLRDAMIKWYRENLNADEIDAELDAMGNVEEEALYFMRVQKLKEKFNHQFMNLEQNFLERFIDEEVYDWIFAENGLDE